MSEQLLNVYYYSFSKEEDKETLLFYPMFTKKEDIKAARVLKYDYTIVPISRIPHLTEKHLYLFIDCFIGVNGIVDYNGSIVQRMIIFNLLSDLFQKTKIRNIVFSKKLNDIYTKLLDHTKFKFMSFFPQEALSHLNKIPRACSTISKIYVKNVKRDVIIKWRKQTKDTMDHSIILNRFQDKINLIVKLQRFVRSSLIKKKLWREIGTNATILRDRLHKNLHAVDVYNKFTFLRPTNVNAFYNDKISRVDLEEIRRVYRYKIWKWKDLEHVYFQIRRILLFDENWDPGDLHHLPIIGENRYFILTDDKYIEIDLYTELVRARIRFTNEYQYKLNRNKWEVEQTTKPIKAKGSLFKRIISGVKSGLLDSLKSLTLDLIPGESLLQLFWTKFGYKHNKNGKIIKNCIWLYDNMTHKRLFHQNGMISFCERIITLETDEIIRLEHYTFKDWEKIREKMLYKTKQKSK
jgi:hypothetical protein